ncbi:MAG: manganese/zinc/iron transport system permease protein, partial [Saprospiraceae bacterium]
VIVLVASFFVVISFVFSPGRGLLFKQIRLIKNRRDLKLKKTLQFMYGIAQTHENMEHPHTVKILNNFQGFTQKSLRKMEENEWILLNKQKWSLTSKGFAEAQNLFNQVTQHD